MSESKVFRVLIGETQGFYVDIEADDEKDAMQKVEAAFVDPNSDLVPIEDNSVYTGYQVEDAVEIDREKADLQTP